MSAETDMEARSRLIDALAAGSNNSDAARVSGYSRKHVIQLQKDAGFMAEVEERKRALAEGDSGAREERIKAGWRVLKEIAEDKSQPAAARVSAARVLVALEAARASAKPTKEPEAAPQKAQNVPEPTPEELQRAIRVLA